MHRTFSTLPARVALGTSIIFSPFLVPIVTAVFVIRAHAETNQETILWLAVVTAFVTVLPILGILWLSRFSQVNDWHLHTKEDRLLPLCFTLVSLILGTVLLHQIGASREIVWACIAYIVNTVVFTAITPLWKISFHTSVTTGCIMVLGFLVDSQLGWLFLLIPLIAWARVYRKRHTLLQTVVGTLLAIANTAVVFHFAPI